MPFANNTVQIFHGDGTAVSALGSYIRSGHTFTHILGNSPITHTIRQLTATDLTIRYTVAGLLQESYSDYDTYFTRR